MTVGLERAYLQLIRQVAVGRLGPVDLLVLPESIVYTVASLDGSRVDGIPGDAHNDLETWNGLFDNVMAWSDDTMAIVAGLETAQRGRLFNSMVFWSPDTDPRWYHKQRLVPFAEYEPWLVRLFGLSGRMFEPGRSSRITEIDSIPIGAFICQEVLIPKIPRRSAASGAELLVSGGNDGVFADPAVAQVHAIHARLRAVETGRYLVRSMKTGVSAIISPTGRYVDRSPSSEPHVVVGNVYSSERRTAFVRWGNWVTPLAAIIVAGFVGWEWLRARRAGSASHRRFGRAERGHRISS
jgi:apolipoprotein N-acyltransferase